MKLQDSDNKVEMEWGKSERDGKVIGRVGKLMGNYKANRKVGK